MKEKHKITKNPEDQASPICRKVQDKIKSSSLPHREDILFISELSGDEWDTVQKNGPTVGYSTEEWTNAIDRRMDQRYRQGWTLAHQ